METGQPVVNKSSEESALPNNGENGPAAKTNKRRPSGSPNSQTDKKKIHRDSLSSTGSSHDDEVIEIDGDDTVKQTDCPKTAHSVRRKFYSDLLARSLAASNSAALSAELEEFQVEDPSDSLLIGLYNLALRNNVSTDLFANSDSFSLYKNLSLTPTIKNLYSPERNPLASSSQTDSTNTKLPSDSTAFCVVENNLYLKSMSKTMEKLNVNMTKHAEKISNHTLRLDHFEQFMDKEIKGLKSRLGANDEERGEMKNLISKAYEYADQKVNALKSAIPITIDELGSEIERKMESISDENKSDSQRFQGETESKIGRVNSRVDNLERILNDKISQIEESHKLEIKAIHERLDVLARGNDPALVNNLQTELRSCKEKLSGYERELGNTNRRLDDAMKKIQALSSGDTSFESTNNTKRLEQKQQKMFDEFSERMAGIEYNVRQNARSQITADILRRKQNIVIDQLEEVENENVIGRLGTIFDTALDPEVRKLITTHYQCFPYWQTQTEPKKLHVKSWYNLIAPWAKNL